MLLLDMTQFKVVTGKRLGSVLVKQFSRAQPGWGLGTGCHETPHRQHRRQIQVLGIGKMCLVWCILWVD